MNEDKINVKVQTKKFLKNLESSLYVGREYFSHFHSPLDDAAFLYAYRQRRKNIHNNTRLNTRISLLCKLNDRFWIGKVEPWNSLRRYLFASSVLKEVINGIL